MKKELHTRKRNRLSDFNYSDAGYYFITLCTKDSNSYFGRINVSASGGGLHHSEIGLKVDEEIKHISSVYKHIYIDKYVIMPNHIHMIVVITADKNGGRTQFAPTISRIIKQFKGSLTKKIGYTIWQKSFYDHIIQSKEEYLQVWKYIDENVARWTEDKYYTN